jgi:hypothetical protein
MSPQAWIDSRIARISERTGLLGDAGQEGVRVREVPVGSRLRDAGQAGVPWVSRIRDLRGMRGPSQPRYARSNEAAVVQGRNARCRGAGHERDRAPHRRDERHSHAHRRAGGGPPDHPLPWVPGVLVFLAPPASGSRGRRVPCGGTRHARIRPDRSARGDRSVHAPSPRRRHGGPARWPWRGVGRDRRPRLGRPRRLARGPAAPRSLPRGRRAERAVPAARRGPSDLRHAPDGRRAVLPALLSGAGRGRSGARARRPPLAPPHPIRELRGRVSRRAGHFQYRRRRDGATAAVAS